MVKKTPINFLDDNLKSLGSGYLTISWCGVGVKAIYHSCGKQIAVTLVYILEAGVLHI